MFIFKDMKIIEELFKVLQVVNDHLLEVLVVRQGLLGLGYQVNPANKF